jgi:hypothetical protein
MVTKRSIKGQMRRVGSRCFFFGRAEAKELKNVLQPDESIIQCAYGYYHGGSGLLVATNKRLLLLDKRPFYLNLESLPYDQLKTIDFMQKMLQGTLYIESGLKKMLFRSISDARLKKICNYTKEKIESIQKPFVSSLNENLPRPTRKPYLNPAWRPHHLTILPRPRTSKFHNSSSQLR